jgi:hypothetical protein
MKMILLNSDTRALQLNQLTDFAQEWFEDSDTGKQKADKMVGRPLVCLHSPYAPSEAYDILLSTGCTLAHFLVRRSRVQPLYMTAITQE